MCQIILKVFAILLISHVFGQVHSDGLERPTGCEEIGAGGMNIKSGVYKIFPSNTKFEEDGFNVYCDFPENQQGWTVIQRRFDGSEDFYRSWVQYEIGFGQLNSEFWLGLDFISELTSQSDMELRVDLTDWDGSTRYAEYSRFRVGNSSKLYGLVVDGYSGNAGDSLGDHNGFRFSTRDKDNDYSSVSCAEKHKGAWWYGSCYMSSLNGIYYATESSQQGVTWRRWRGFKSLKVAEMKIRKRADVCAKNT